MFYYFLISNALPIGITVLFCYLAYKNFKHPSIENKELINPQCDWPRKIEDAKRFKQEVVRSNPQYRDLDFLVKINAVGDSSKGAVLTDKGVFIKFDNGRQNFAPYSDITDYQMGPGYYEWNGPNGVEQKVSSGFRSFTIFFNRNGSEDGIRVSVPMEDVTIFMDTFIAIMNKVQGR